MNLVTVNLNSSNRRFNFAACINMRVYAADLKLVATCTTNVWAKAVHDNLSVAKFIASAKAAMKTHLINDRRHGKQL